ncbi:MAG TPA: MFS transporter [Desulfatiglandales bacterium]|nr:MFS transporter [Desulfatiglandales bacterium]
MAERLKKSLLYTFGVGDLFFTLLVCMEVYFFNAFLTDYAKFSLVIVSFIVLVVGFGDILCALAAGVVLQKVSLKFGGKYRSWLLICPPIVALLFILQFSKIGGEYIAAAIIIFGFLASHLLWNVQFAATGALVGSLTQLPDERTILSSSRAQGTAAASLIFAFTGQQMFKFFGERTTDIIGLSITILIYGVLMILGYLYIYRITAVGDPSEPKVVNTEIKETKETKKTLREIVVLVFKNPPLLWLIVAETFRNILIFMVLSFAFYYFGYVLNNPGFLSVFIIASSVATLLGTFAAPWIGIRIGKRKAYWISLVLAAFVFLSMAFIEAGTWSFTVIFCIAAMLGMISGSMQTALFADTVVYGEWKTGKNIQAFTMSLLMLPVKFGLLIRSGIINLGLISIGFIAGEVPTPEVVSGISSIMIYSPAIASILAGVIFYFGYRIEDKDVIKMQDEIAAR